MIEKKISQLHHSQTGSISKASPGSKALLVSVVMPVYNAERHLKYSIESILKQSCSSLELIIVNDGSTDGSREIIKSFTDPRIRYFENRSNMGLVEARNKCLQEAQGDYIAVLDSDDIALPVRIEEQVRFLEANRRYGLCGTFFRVMDADGRILYNVDVPTHDAAIKISMKFGNCFCHSTVMMRASQVKALRYADGLDYIEDYDLLYRVSANTKVANLPIFTTLYRTHGTNTSITTLPKKLPKLENMNARILTEMGISFSPEELSLHTEFLRLNTHFFATEERINSLEIWLKNFCKKMSSNYPESEKSVSEIIMRRWVQVCLKTKHYRKMPGLPVRTRYKWIYLKIMWEKFLAQSGRLLAGKPMTLKIR